MFFTSLISGYSQHNERILVHTELSTSVSLEHFKIFLLLLFNLALFLEWNIMISGVGSL